jgi:hypothetical protein
MSLLLSDDALQARAAVAHAELAPLADSLTRELATVYARPLYVPSEKALLSREGGRCARDGAMLDFDPFSPDRHRCPVCGEFYTGELHHRFWIYWYQLWLIERAVHGALFAALGCSEPSGAFSAADAASFSSNVLTCYVDQYPRYPNRDNVLGPTRLFFSTYLESIWLLNLCIALDLLESQDRRFAELGGRIREQIIEPSAALIASYDEGASNRQVWNAAALVAANRLLGRGAEVERALFGQSGIAYHLQNGLLPDGTWYEGENYHLFAHRALWYGVTMAEALGATLPAALVARFQEGFVTPFLTSLPDMTLPSRRDSQYAISLRQPRFAELCELGLARQTGDGDPRLRGVLFRLYSNEVPRGDTGRSRTAADVERNLPGTALSRADLGWRSLLFARPALPPLAPAPLGTVLLEAQGLAVFRRERERIYVALDYGASGGGHGHPDRLNVMLSDGPTRWLDDMGTGSYVDPSLHWYRSTLAHNAPIFDGYQQQRVDGELIAFDDGGGASWVSAVARGVHPGVTAMRTLVVMPDYVLDELRWYSDQPVVMDLPIHLDADEVSGRVRPFGDQLEDTYGALANIASHFLPPHGMARLTAHDGDRSLHGFLLASGSGVLYQVTAPGPPGAGRKAFLVLRVTELGSIGWVRTIWSWRDTIELVRTEARARVTRVHHRDGTRDYHRRSSEGWQVERVAGTLRTKMELGGIVRRGKTSSDGEPAEPAIREQETHLERALVFELGREQYRRSEESWEEAGRPSARVGILRMPNELVVDVAVRKRGELTFPPGDAVNVYDNESPDINGDGIQLYLYDTALASAWVLVPEVGGAEEGAVRARPIEGWDRPRALRAVWHRTHDGYAVRVRIESFPLAPNERQFALGVVINEKPVGRERRRGQLVLGGRPGEFVYLRGDREDLSQLVRFIIS